MGSGVRKDVQVHSEHVPRGDLNSVSLPDTWISKERQANGSVVTGSVTLRLQKLVSISSLTSMACGKVAQLRQLQSEKAYRE